jgi:hypothetical protein
MYNTLSGFHGIIKLSKSMQLGQHSLYFASFNGNLSIVLLLIQRRADIDLPTDVSKLIITYAI